MTHYYQKIIFRIFLKCARVVWKKVVFFTLFRRPKNVLLPTVLNQNTIFLFLLDIWSFRNAPDKLYESHHKIFPRSWFFSLGSPLASPERIMDIIGRGNIFSSEV